MKPELTHGIAPAKPTKKKTAGQLRKAYASMDPAELKKRIQKLRGPTGSVTRSNPPQSVPSPNSRKLKVASNVLGKSRLKEKFGGKWQQKTYGKNQGKIPNAFDATRQANTAQREGQSGVSAPIEYSKQASTLRRQFKRAVRKAGGKTQAPKPTGKTGEVRTQLRRSRKGL